jgi:hypothetical protein
VHGAAVALGCLLLSSCNWDGNFTILGYTTRPNYDTSYKTVRVRIFLNPTFWAVVPVPGLEMELTRELIRQIELKTPYKVVSGPADTEILGYIMAFNKGILSYNQLFEVREAETTLFTAVLWRDLHTGKILTLPGRVAGTPPGADAIPAPPPLSASPSPQLALGPVPSSPLSPLNNPGLTEPATAPVAPGAIPPVVTPPAGGAPPVPGVPPVPGAPPIPGAPPPATLPLTGSLPTPQAFPLAFQTVRSTGHFRPELGETIATAQLENIQRLAVQIVSMMESPW